MTDKSSLISAGSISSGIRAGSSTRSGYCSTRTTPSDFDINFCDDYQLNVTANDILPHLKLENHFETRTSDAEPSLRQSKRAKIKPTTLLGSKQAPSHPKHGKQIRKKPVRHPEPDGDGNDVYEVEAVIGKKREGSQTHYLVKWTGYEETTWLPPWDLDNCIDLVHEFENAQAASENTAHSRGVLPKMVTSHSRSQCQIPTYPGQQTTIYVATAGRSGVERGQHVVGILAHKPKVLRIHGLEDVDFLVNYAGESPIAFVSYEVCVRLIPMHVANYLARHTVIPRAP